MKLGLIVTSTRPQRINPKVADWVREQLPADWDVEVLDLAAINLPFLDEDEMPSSGNYQKQHTKDWSAAIQAVDAVLIVTPEYNSGYPASIKNAIDYLFTEWRDKPIAVVGYGWRGARDSRAGLVTVFNRIKANSVGTVGMFFTKDLSPEGEVMVRDEVRDEIAALIKELGESVSR